MICRLIIIFLLVAFSFTFISCDEKIRITVPSEVAPTILLRGGIYDGLPLRVYAGKVLPTITGAIDYRLPPESQILLYKDGEIIQELIIDTTVETSNLSGSWFVSIDTIFLEEGSSYFLVANSPGLRSVVSDTLLFERNFRIDNLTTSPILGPNNFFNDTVIVSVQGRMQSNFRGNYKLFLGLYQLAENVQIPSTLRAFDTGFSDYVQFSYLLAQNPIAGNYTQDITHNIGVFSRREDRNYFYLVEIVSFGEPYESFFDAVLERQGRFEDLSGVDADLDNVPSNINGGEGLFSISERYLFVLPIQ